MVSRLTHICVVDPSTRSAASDLGLHCLPMSHNGTLGLYGLITLPLCTGGRLLSLIVAVPGDLFIRYLFSL